MGYLTLDHKLQVRLSPHEFYYFVVHQHIGYLIVMQHVGAKLLDSSIHYFHLSIHVSAMTIENAQYNMMGPFLV